MNRLLFLFVNKLKMEMALHRNVVFHQATLSGIVFLDHCQQFLSGTFKKLIIFIIVT